MLSGSGRCKRQKEKVGQNSSLHAGLVFLQSDVEQAATAMRDEFELSGGRFFRPCACAEAEVLQRLQACAPAGQAHATRMEPSDSAAVCPGGTCGIGPAGELVMHLEARMDSTAGHPQMAAASDTGGGADVWAIEGECVCAGPAGAAQAHHEPHLALEPDQAPGPTAGPGSHLRTSVAAGARGWPCTVTQADAAAEASTKLARSAGTGTDCSAEGAGAAGLSAGQTFCEAPASDGAHQAPPHGGGPCRQDEQYAAEADWGGGRPHAPLRWAEAGYLPANPLVRTAVLGACTR